ncbi:hypothetical protein FQR65_LT08140 [Abscondita terminalis]|nr:hypothetical protein FQR65_LT08140 [Abscondita terminalis]
MEIKEFKISVPWGHIAVKAWGDEENKAILMIHGLNDNAGSFDMIIPHLSKNHYYVCIDLPGHGKSSQFPKNAPVQEVNVLMALKIVVEYLKKKKIAIIAHSWGAQFSTLFTQLYPEHIEKLILIEGVCLSPVSIEYFKQFTTEYIDKAIHVLNKLEQGNIPTFTYEKALNLLINGRPYGKLNKDAAEAILKRHLQKVDDDQYLITSDLRNRVRHALFISKDYVIRLFKKHNINCPVLFIFAKNALPQKDYYIDMLKIIKQSNNNCTIMELEGDHDIHMNAPELIASVINEYLNRFSSKL